ncbi:MAG: thiamine pyrophosphate-dependent enzyme, partial [Acetobacteraceae bacterium]
VKLERFYGHFEGDAMTYRAANEVAQLRAERDCLAFFRRRVTDAALLDIAQLDAISEEATTLVDEAVSEAKAAAFPTASDLLTDVYASY